MGVASAFPIAFLSNIFVFILLNIALAIEFTGICAASWFFGSIHKKIAGFQLDEVYVGTAEERAAGKHPDTSIHPGREFTIGTNLLGGATNWDGAIQNLSGHESIATRRERMNANIAELQELAASAESPAEQQSYQTAIEMENKGLRNLEIEEQDAAARKGEEMA